MYIDAVNGWDFNTSKNAHKYILPHNTSLIIKPQDFCNTPVFLIIIVCSAPNNFEARNVIRDTWASMENLSQFSVKIYFLLGQALTIDYGVCINKFQINKLFNFVYLYRSKYTMNRKIMETFYKIGS